MKHKPIAAFIFCALLMLFGQTVFAQNFTVEFDASTFYQIQPFDRSIVVYATISNTGSDTEHVPIEVSFTPEGGWGDPHSPIYVYLEPGEIARPVIFSGVNLGRYHQHTLNCTFYSTRDTLNKVHKSVELIHVGQHLTQAPIRDFIISGDIDDVTTGNPIEDARVYIWDGGRPERARSEPQGRFALNVQHYDSLKALSDTYNKGWQGYRIEVHRAGYHSAVLDSLAPQQGQNEINLTIHMKPLDDIVNFQSSWYTELERPGVWHVIPSDDWNYISVCLGKHPDSWDVHPDSTEVYLFTGTGTKLWNYQVNEYVWGMDMKSDGSFVVAGTDNAQVVCINQSGELVWSHELPNHTQIREVRISHNGNYVCYEVNPFKMFDTGTGNTIWEFPFLDNRWRGISFSPDDQYVAIGGGESLVLLDINGNMVWERYIGGIVPYFIGITPGTRKLVIADKGDQLTCYDGAGNLKWRHFITVLTDADMSNDGSRIAALSHDGIVRLYDGNGNLLWKRAVDDNGGHNAIDMTSDGKYIVVGGASNDAPFKTMLWDENGNLLWEHSQPGDMPDPYHPYLISAMSVAISDNATKIVTGYGDAGPGIQVFTSNIITSVDYPSEDLSDVNQFKLDQNFPNPFNSKTQIEYTLPKTEHVILEIYNLLGQKVYTLIDKKQLANHYKVEWDASRFSSGIYVYRLKAADFTKMKKMILIK